jgi:hypothetical protein
MDFQFSGVTSNMFLGFFESKYPQSYLLYKLILNPFPIQGQCLSDNRTYRIDRNQDLGHPLAKAASFAFIDAKSSYSSVNVILINPLFLQPEIKESYQGSFSKLAATPC